jgi:signal transduction histidine kinase
LKRFVVTLCCLLTISVAAFVLISLPRDEAGVAAVDGTLNLTDADFSDALFSLAGEWEFYYDHLYGPTDFATGIKPQGRALIEVPVGWEAQGYPGYGATTYRLIIRTADEDSLMLRVPEIVAASRVYVNGVLVFTAGSVDSGESALAVRNDFIPFSPKNGSTEIIVQASSHAMSGGSGICYAFELGRPNNLLREVIGQRVSLTFVLGAILMMGLYHLFLFFYHRREKIYLIFATFTLICLVRFPLETNGLAQFFLPGGLDEFWLRVYLSMFGLVTAILILFTFTALDMRLPKRRLPRLLLLALYGVPTAASVILQLVMPPVPLLTFLCFPPLAAVIVQGFYTWRTHPDPYRALYLISMCIFIVWAPLTKVLLGDHLFMPGLASNLFLTMSQCAMLAKGYAEARQREEILSVENATLDRMNTLKSELMQTISHEARTPLAVLASYAGLVSVELRSRGVGREITGDLEKIEYEARRVADLIDSMKKLTLAQEEGVRRMPLDVGEIVRQTARLYQPILERGGVRLEFDLPDDLSPVLGNPEELTQILFNLLQNARNHTERGRIHILVRQDADVIIVTVADTGAGIAPEMLPRVFERGVSGMEGGSGVGLAVCRELVEAHEGTINIQSEPGRGTTVTLTMPTYGGVTR